MNTIQSVLPADATARVLEEYLASAAQSRESGFDSDEAMSTDSSFIDESSSSLATSSDVASAFSSLTLFDRLHTGSIGSDDSGFSSDDEFADDEIRARQRLRKDLVLGRPPAALMRWRARELVDLHEAYMKQLADADVELAELTGVANDVIVRRPVTVEYRAPPDVNGQDTAAIVRDLRMRSAKEIADMERPESVGALVLLAQALFRREKEVKRILYSRSSYRMDEDSEDD
ncbi:uncharacterized protein C8Q71DRAFT_721196 [Rhodofomes roseus]|uniref:Uncharacterized protein n=1 Tax=Rhodofomes roseus TaxID=34475 RepID=A0ABQ8KQ03_9APHY|nr:uncharacterized protein C8Q71DRAFT_721196 [Rhodofomes roseus]KAH9840697.1 hypothetical protein C8Q71DRAFT_721196 [Rhodofomes roseus]